MTVTDVKELSYRGRDVKKMIQQKFKEYQLRGQCINIYPERVKLICDYSTLAPEIVDDAYTFFTDVIDQMVKNKSNRVHYVLNGGRTTQKALIMLNLIPGMMVEGACTEVSWKEKGYIDIKLYMNDVSSEEFYAKRYYEYALEHLS